MFQDGDYPNHPDDLQAKQTITDWKDSNRKEGADHLTGHQNHFEHYKKSVTEN